MKRWIPTRLMSEDLEEREREDIVDRSLDLCANNPYASGTVDTFASVIVGTGLNPYPTIPYKLLGMDKARAKDIGKQQRAAFNLWAPFADAGGRMSFAALTYLTQREIVKYGEYLFLIQMIDDPGRPFMFALMPISPLRLKTPTDLLRNTKIKQGVEVGKYGEPVAYWIKKAGAEGAYNDNSSTYTRIPAKAGHRWRVLHGFPQEDPETYRGYPFFSAAMKFFLDLSDFVDAELVSNIVTAAQAIFIEVDEDDPTSVAEQLATFTDEGTKSDGTTYDNRIEEINPGGVYYGGAKQKPHILKSDRPGRTFEPFVEVIERLISMSVNIPHPVLFKNFKGMNYASYRSAMLEAWRVFYHRRQWLGGSFCQRVYRMVQEEAVVRGMIDLSLNEFYASMVPLTAADWIGPPKGQIEPVKEIQAEILAVKNNLKSRSEAMLGYSRDFEGTIDSIADEQDYMREAGVDEADFVLEPEVKETPAKEED